jgi:hypothetical protein
MAWVICSCSSGIIRYITVVAIRSISWVRTAGPGW